jgi:hypothetical protein
MEAIDWPACKKCSQGVLIPLSDYGRDGAPITQGLGLHQSRWVQSPDRRDLGGRTIGPSYK